MIELTQLDGFVVITAINRDTGEATSETYALRSVSEFRSGAQRLVVHQEDGRDFSIEIAPLAKQAVT